jgi:carboxy-terminal domain RNA polymerase II polypeptide A small phosphatase
MPNDITKKLLILDLDETLIHATRIKLSREPDFMVFDYFVYKRPHLAAFLAACSDIYQLAIWSSASDDYVEEVVKNIISPTIKLEFVWGRSKCTPRYPTQEDFFRDSYDNQHYYYTKQLKKIKKQGFSLDRTLIVDDTPEKVKDNFGNAIYPTAFLGDLEEENELLLLLDYLKYLDRFDNIRKIEKRNWRRTVFDTPSV